MSIVLLLDVPTFPTRRSSDLLRLGQRQVGAPQVLGKVGVELGKTLNMQLVDNGVVPGCIWRCVIAPVEDGIDHPRSEEHTSELQSRGPLGFRLLLEKRQPTKQ